MDHFIAYHSTERMGYRYEPSEDLNFLSTKKGLLIKAQGNFVWCIEGVSGGNGTEYFLCGVYLADKIEELPTELFSIHGPRIAKFSTPLLLNDYDWFTSLRRSQGNFGLGFNRINDMSVVESLEGILDPTGEIDDLLNLDSNQETDRSILAKEGSLILSSHFRRERNRLLVKAKKTTILRERGRVACEACGFDFFAMYGSIGKNYCEVHHIRPLATYDDLGEVSTLDDLVILCSNCHRMIHRSNPFFSVDELAALISHHKN